MVRELERRGPKSKRVVVQGRTIHALQRGSTLLSEHGRRSLAVGRLAARGDRGCDLALQLVRARKLGRREVLKGGWGGRC